MINNLSDLNEQLDLFFNHLNEEKICETLAFDIDQTTVNKFKKNINYYYRWTEERDDKSLVKIVIDCLKNVLLNEFILEEMEKLIKERIVLYKNKNKDYLIIIDSNGYDDNEILEKFNNLIVFCEKNKVACKIFHNNHVSKTNVQLFVNSYWIK